jgi:hypothetical protein
MSELPYEPEVPASDYGRARREAWLVHLRQQDALSRDLEGHRAVSDVLRAGQQGILGHLSGQEQAASVAARPVTLGTDWGDGRALERLGGTTESIAPAPARVDLRHVNAPNQRPTGESPLARYMRGRD